MSGETHRGGQHILVFMSPTNRLCLINHVLPKLAQCVALLEARWERLSMAITVSAEGQFGSLIGALRRSPELPRLALEGALLSGHSLLPAVDTSLWSPPRGVPHARQGLSPRPSETDSVWSRFPRTDGASLLSPLTGSSHSL